MDILSIIHTMLTIAYFINTLILFSIIADKLYNLMISDWYFCAYVLVNNSSTLIDQDKYLNIIHDYLQDNMRSIFHKCTTLELS